MKQFVPVVTSEAGACLTLANWQEIGAKTLAYYLDAWLMKPGYALLNSLPNLRSYCGWKGTIVLNASLAPAKMDGIYTLRSRYDGSTVRISSEELISLIIKLAPDLVVLPPGLAAYIVEQRIALPKTMQPFIPAKEFLESEYLGQSGVYLSYESTSSFENFLAQFEQLKAKPCYLSGHFDRQQAQLLLKEGVQWLETDKPASDAFVGLVYGETEDVGLVDNAIAEQHQPIYINCSCPTCAQKFTKAYLHHLLLQTPLLCQRFLIQHNAHNYQMMVETLPDSK
ncbi:queuine tRNA-ribosyltransferase [Legionella massiliensis]|uniref:Queuine tRNA-ribosyltransferase n=1 Tax=Legionella massiliensis TaxID=1034943 RepID=A0A078KRP5_9GAMM|nr:hypothetical protein [Legionella massiliensis]CDZ77095.1 queuine tRNA-ribosyltransferase [Legionella massiliensis]CEE12833.1 Queuine tRNA-ribosyltransferase [Legionella massiliensis]